MVCTKKSFMPDELHLTKTGRRLLGTLFFILKPLILYSDVRREFVLAGWRLKTIQAGIIAVPGRPG